MGALTHPRRTLHEDRFSVAARPPHPPPRPGAPSSAPRRRRPGRPGPGGHLVPARAAATRRAGRCLARFFPGRGPRGCVPGPGPGWLLPATAQPAGQLLPGLHAAAQLRHQLPGPGRPEWLRFRQPVGDRLGGQLLRALQLPVGRLLRARRSRPLPAGRDYVLRRDVPVRRVQLRPGQRPGTGPGVSALEHGQRLPARADHLVHPRQRGHLDHRFRRQADDRRSAHRARLHPGAGDQPRLRRSHRAGRRVRAWPRDAEPGIRHGRAGGERAARLRRRGGHVQYQPRCPPPPR